MAEKTWPWHVINGEDLRDLLRRAHEGEDPETLYIEAYVNAEREQVERSDDEQT